MKSNGGQQTPIAPGKPAAPKDAQAQQPRRGHSGDGAASVLPRLKEWERSRAKDRADSGRGSGS
ncbi:MAG: hypothetical protein V4787_17380 [Pseudomonadota bacterium]